LTPQQLKILNYGYSGRNGFIRLLLTGKVMPQLLMKEPGAQGQFDEKIPVRIEPYKGSNPHVKEISSYLQSNLESDLICALVHGSLATGEEIPFSDFDGLLILKNEVFRDTVRLQHVARMIRKSMKLIYEYDPFQHHGWFIMREEDLRMYPQTYFPDILFSSSRIIFPDRAVELEIHSFPAEKTNYLSPFLSLSDEVIRKAEKGGQHYNRYILKGFLSQVMLLPALYCQAKYRRGILKKDSFTLARNDFSDDEWIVMDEVSQVRRSWQSTLTGRRRYMMTRIHPLLARFRGKFAPATSKSITSFFSRDTYDRIIRLSGQMKKKLDENKAD
jgi:hypothetical protein